MPWWSRELWALRHQLRRSYQAKCSFPSDEFIKSYSALKSRYQQQVRQSKIQSWRNFCSSDLNSDLFGSPKEITSASSNQCPSPLIKTNGKTHPDSDQMLEAFSSYFFPKEALSSPLHLLFKEKVRKKINKPLKSFMNITNAEVITALTTLKSNQSPGIDSCPAEWLKCCTSLISQHVTALFNACLASSYFPAEWQISRVIILRKPNKPHFDDPSSYQPISIICSKSKVFERILHSRLKSLSESAPKTWFNDSQHGFRVGRSTESAGSTLVQLIEGNLKEKLTTCCAFLDIKSAFSTA